MRKRKLGHWQIKALEDIVFKRACCHLRILDKVIGTARAKWDRKYRKSLLHAIQAHNEGAALNSPIDPNFVIVLEPCGFALVPRGSIRTGGISSYVKMF